MMGGAPRVKLARAKERQVDAMAEQAKTQDQLDLPALQNHHGAGT